MSFSPPSVPLFVDYSVNGARTYQNQDKHLILESNIRTNTAGNFVGGGVGNKPIAGLNLPELDGLPIAQLPRLRATVRLNTSSVAPKGIRGLSYNVFVDLQGNGNPADVGVMSVTSTLNGVVDALGKTGAEASMNDFDIGAFATRADLLGNAWTGGGQSMDNAFYVVNGVPGGPVGTGGLWTGIPMSLDVLLNGGIMPLTGAVFATPFPNAKLVGVGALANYVSTDGGMPAGTPVVPVTLQIGDSSLNLRGVTEVTSFTVGSQVLI